MNVPDHRRQQLSEFNEHSQTFQHCITAHQSCAEPVLWVLWGNQDHVSIRMRHMDPNIACTTTRSTGMKTISHVRNKSSLNLSRAIFDRAVTLTPPEYYA